MLFELLVSKALECGDMDVDERANYLVCKVGMLPFGWELEPMRVLRSQNAKKRVSTISGL